MPPGTQSGMGERISPRKGKRRSRRSRKRSTIYIRTTRLLDNEIVRLDTEQGTVVKKRTYTDCRGLFVPDDTPEEW